MSDAIATPLRFTENCDIELVNEEGATHDDIRNAVFTSRFPLFEFGVGIEEFVFDPLDFPSEVWLADRIAFSIGIGVPRVNVFEEQIFFSESTDQHKRSIVVPYQNRKTGKQTSALLSVDKQRTDLP